MYITVYLNSYRILKKHICLIREMKKKMLPNKCWYEIHVHEVLKVCPWMTTQTTSLLFQWSRPWSNLTMVLLLLIWCRLFMLWRTLGHSLPWARLGQHNGYASRHRRPKLPLRFLPPQGQTASNGHVWADGEYPRREWTGRERLHCNFYKRIVSGKGGNCKERKKQWQRRDRRRMRIWERKWKE